jgi:hypothetical protein
MLGFGTNINYLNLISVFFQWIKKIHYYLENKNIILFTILKYMLNFIFVGKFYEKMREITLDDLSIMEKVVHRT